MIAVTGASGGVGGRVARTLASQGLPLRLVVREYAEYVPLFASPEGVIRGPAGDGRAAFVSRHDVAEVAAAVLADPGPYEGNTYDVTGPEALGLDEAAAILSRAAGREVVYERETLEQARDSRLPSGAPDWEIEGWVTSYAALSAGALEPPSDTVQRILGRPPPSLADVLREHPERLAHLRP